ncbi:MAG: hypothetical protein EOM30_03680 [Clostridia bacterium]|nr:hypothetical protein [Clostridia bacterium]
MAQPPSSEPEAPALYDAAQQGGSGIDFSGDLNNYSFGAALSEGGYHLTANLTLDSYANFTISAGTVNINLNGYTITGAEDQSIFSVEDGGILNLYNENIEDTTGILTHASGKGGQAVYVSGGSFNMYGGTITGNNSSGVYVENTGIFTMYGGSITANTVIDDGYGKGGGVCAERGGNFIMRGGSITNNTADDMGGGVYVDGSFAMTGGSITDNAALNNGGGVYVRSGAVTIGGTAQITDNKNDGDGAANNLYLASGRKITISATTAPTTGMSVGVSMQRNGVFTDESGAGCSDYFTSDSTAHHVEEVNGVLSIADGPAQTGHKHNNILFDQELTLTSGAVAAGNYYLEKDLTLEGGLDITDGNTVSICLNGHKIIGVDLSNVFNIDTLPTAKEQSYTITPMAITATVTAVDKPYDGTDTASVSATATGVTGDTITITGLTGKFAQKTVGNSIKVTVDSSKAAIDAALQSSYTVTYSSTTNASITRRAVTVKAKPQSKNYKAADPATFDYDVENIVKGETLKGKLTRDAGEDVKVGGYAITQGTLTNANNPNYAITFTNGTLTITKTAQGEFKIVPHTEPVTYGDAPFTLATTGGSGKGDIKWTATGAGTVDENGKITVTGAGEIVITATKAADVNHAEPVTVSYTITVAKKALTWDLSELNVTTKKHYNGDTTAAYTGSLKVAGAVEGDDVGFGYTSLSVNYTDAAAGKHAITVVPVGLTLTNGNYLQPTTAITYDGEIVPVQEVPGQPNLPEIDGQKTRIVLEVGLSLTPDSLVNTQFNTPAIITGELLRVLTQNAGYTNDRTITYDVILQISPDGGNTWENATMSNFPPEGITVLIPYPAGHLHRAFTCDCRLEVHHPCGRQRLINKHHPANRRRVPDYGADICADIQLYSNNRPWLLRHEKTQ